MTNFVLVETLFWKKPNSYPMTSSRTAMSRSVEQVFVFVRKSERATFRCNKTRDPVTKKYSYASSFIEAANNDGATESTCRARFSTDFAKQVLSKYLAKRKRSTVVLDPFVGSGEQSLVPDSPLFTHTHTHATGTTFRACADLGFACVGVELVEAHLDQTCVQGVPLTKPEEEPQALGYKRKRSEDVESPANFFGCKIHRGADNCRLAMQSPERAFGLEVLRQRWQIAKKAMAGTQVLRSDVLTTLNAPLSSEEVKGAPGALSKRKDNLLCPQNFWHDLALLALFTQKKSVRIAGKISHAVTFTC